MGDTEPDKNLPRHEADILSEGKQTIKNKLCVLYQ